MKSLLDLGPRECRFALTDNSPHFFCSAKTDGRSYCPEHDAICVEGPGKDWHALAAMIEKIDQSTIAGPLAEERVTALDGKPLDHLTRITGVRLGAVGV